ncbi:MAG: hypothetical protein ABSH56_14410 [Bryobacteraceae bacterium]|jgi:endoglucanase
MMTRAYQMWIPTSSTRPTWRGWAWTYWQFDSDSIVYDMAKDDSVLPIWRALISES